MKMQLRPFKKQKRKDDDIAYEYQHPQSQKKHVVPKVTNDKEPHCSNENSNLSNEHEVKSKHKLRNSSSNFQGKYKKMNSGKYLYKVQQPDKKAPLPKKKKLKFIQSDLLNHFRKMITHFHTKEEDNLMNKKRKREESKTKVKQEKARPSARPSQQMQQYTTQGLPNQGLKYPTNHDYMNRYMHQELFGQNRGYIPSNMAQYMFLIKNQDYQMLPNNQESKEQFKTSLLTYWLEKDTRNHIIGAFYINQVQNQMQNKEKRIEYKKIPLNMVALNDGSEENEMAKNEPEQTLGDLKAKILEEKQKEPNNEKQIDVNTQLLSQNQQQQEQKEQQEQSKEQKQINNMSNGLENNYKDIEATVEEQLTKVKHVVNCKKDD